MTRQPVGRTALCLVLSAWLALGPAAALACSVPVFRYALERWPSDAYRVAIFHRGKLSEADQAVVDWLKKTGAREDGYDRIALRTFDVAGELGDDAKPLWKAQKEPKLPWMVVLYPEMTRIPAPAWAGKLTAQAARRLVASPARKEIASRILAGEAAVWVLLESGQREKDEAAAKLLEAQLKKLEKELQLPEQIDPAAVGGAPQPGDAAPPVEVEIIGDEPADLAMPDLKVAFSVLRIKRTDPAEQIFVQMLLHTEEDLPKLNEPIAFPIYGRARALFALVGAGINEENIFDACAFLIGPCSCQVKAQNPGTDLLLLTDWDGSLMGELVKDELPPLIGLPEPVAEAKAPPSTEPVVALPKQEARPAVLAARPPTDQGPAPEPPHSTMWRNTLMAVAAAVVVLGLATVVVLRKSRLGQD